MQTFTVSIPEALKKKVEEHKEINIPEYLKQRFQARIKELNKFENLRNSGRI